jgi:putative ABC transport system permease protein
MNLIQFLGALELGLIFSLVTLGVYLTFRAINFPDLTVDGSFPLGAAVSAALIVADIDPSLIGLPKTLLVYKPLFATFMAFIAGTLAGFVTGYLNVRWKILGLLAGILTMTALYSVNLRIMGRPNIPLLSEPTLFNLSEGPHMVRVIILGIVSVITLLLFALLSSQFGLAFRATGINPKVSPSYGINVGRMTLFGLALSNGLVALAGALYAQAHGFADISMGTGTLIIGLASVIIGESILRKHSIFVVLLSCILGSIFYWLVRALALNTQIAGLQASDLNMITAGLVVIAMLIPQLRQKIQCYRQKT